MRRAARFGLVLAAACAALPAWAADLGGPRPATGFPTPGFMTPGFLATCEDLGGLCWAEACGRDQIAAALACRARCPSSAVLRVAPAACPLPAPPVVLRRRG